MKRPSFQASAETRLLTQALEAVKPGDIITYEAMETASGADLKTNRGPLQTALRRMLRDHDAVFAAVRGVGYQRLVDGEIANEASVNTTRLRRQAMRNLERASKADVSALPASQQAKFTAALSVTAAIAQMTKPKEVERIASGLDDSKRELPIKETLAFFAKRE